MIEGAELAALVDSLDLGPFETRDDLIALLQERRADQLETLAIPLTVAVSLASRVRLRATQRHEVQICEQALDRLGAPHYAPNIEEDTAA